ncbi:MAG: M48 family metalloprotease [Deferrisomatales bacterium]|nr:M48 family metalloprotease [Deferrisomatales bacterium]
MKTATRLLALVLAALLLPAAAGAFLDRLGRGVLQELAPKPAEAPPPAQPDDKAPAEPSRRQDRTGLILGGVTDLLAGAAEVPYETEVVIGESLALEGFARYGRPVEDPDLQRYVNRVGNAVARNSPRPEIPYRFVVVQGELYNAFACPGGIVFVSSQLVRSMGDEAELAAVLAHEVGHVAHRHALQSIRRAQFFSGVGQLTAATMRGEKGREFQGMIGDLQGVLFDRGLDRNMEFEADATGMETAYRTGYDPAGMVRVLEMLQRNEATARKGGSWFSTHPPLGERLSRLRTQLAQYPDAASLARVPERFAPYSARL